jgi:hypothetical protein
VLQIDYGLIGGIFGILGMLVYMRARPTASSQIIWAALGAVFLETKWISPDHGTIWLPVAYFIGPIVLATVSIRKEPVQFDWIDKSCLIFAAVSIPAMLIYQGLAVVFLAIALLVDAAGIIPTMRDIRTKPGAVSWEAFGLYTIAGFINLLGTEHWNFEGAAYNVYMFAACVVITTNALRYRRKNSNLKLSKV